MGDRIAILAVGLVLVVVAVLAAKVFLFFACLIGLAWLCWKLVRWGLPLLYSWMAGRAKVLLAWWRRRPWEDALERAQRKAVKEIENTVHYYVDMQKRAEHWADAHEN